MCNNEAELLEHTVFIAKIDDPKLRGLLYDMAESYEGQDKAYSE